MNSVVKGNDNNSHIIAQAQNLENFRYFLHIV